MQRDFILGMTIVVLLAAPAMAADMPVKAPVAPAPVGVAHYSWTGFYIGVNAGFAWGRATATDSPASTGACWATCGTRWGPDVDSFIGGGQAGWNVQLQNWVLGIEGDVGYLGLKGRAADAENDDELFVKTRGGLFATLRGRAGVLLSPTVLVYGSGGAIYADTRTNVSRTTTNFKTSNADPWGWTAGGGVEARLNPAWSWKLEYLYYDLGKDRVDGPIGITGITQFFPVQQAGHIVRGGINYRFGGPVVARY